MDNYTVFSTVTSEELIEKAGSVQSLSEMEHTLRQVLQKLGNILLHLWLVWLIPRYCSPTVSCPYCDQDAQYQRKRWGKLIILSRKLLKRGTFSSVADLKAKVLAFIVYFNRTVAEPFRWTYRGKALAA